MSISLSSNQVAEKNKTATSSCWLWFMQITLLDSTVYRFVHNTEELTYDDNKYTAAGFDIGVIKSDTEGTVPQTILKVANPGRLMQKVLEDNDAAEGATIVLTRVNSKLIDEDHSNLEYSFTIMGAEADEQWIYFKLGSFNPINRLFPLGRYKAFHCDYIYGEAECGYSGALPTCDHTLDGDDGCIVHGNAARFGGWLGMKNGGLKIA